MRSYQSDFTVDNGRREERLNLNLLNIRVTTRYPSCRFILWKLVTKPMKTKFKTTRYPIMQNLSVEIYDLAYENKIQDLVLRAAAG